MRQPFPKTSRFKQIVADLALTGAVLSAAMTVASQPATVSASPAYASITVTSRYFPNSGHSIGGSFLKFFDANGGVNVFGLPITDEILENGTTVQYFERQRFEYHPELAGTPYEVQLSLLGSRAAVGQPDTTPVIPFASHANLIYIATTGHSLSGAFLQYWYSRGGVRLFGYPVSEPFTTGGLTVQYFERARMEYHPELEAKGYVVELTLLGKLCLQGQLGTGSVDPFQPQITPVSQAPAPPAQGHALDTYEQDLLNRINGARASAGISPVAYDATVSALALHRSSDMAAKNYFSHTAPGGDTYLALLKSAGVPFKYAGEIIAWNNYPPDQTEAQAFQGFMNSPEHHAIIMDPRYNYTGVGEAKNSSGGYYYTVIFVQK